MPFNFKKTNGKTIECERCCYEYAKDFVVFVECAFFCETCDEHAGYVCKNCLSKTDKVIKP